MSTIGQKIVNIIRTPEELAMTVVDPRSNVGQRLLKHIAPPLIEDLTQAIAMVIRQDRQNFRSS